jgi:uncharacterized phage protein gp47/JayE
MTTIYPYGVTPQGFNGKSQSQIINEIQDSIQGIYGANVNLSPSSNLGQVTGITSEREALVWQIAEAVYNSFTVGGSEGTSVDNILALNNLRRLPASHTVTNPSPLTQSNGITLYGLRVLGIAGTLVEAGSFIQNDASPPLQFTIDNDITIQPAVNAVQGIFFSNNPTMGAFTLTMPDSVVTASIPYNSLAQVAQLSFSQVPTLGTYIVVLECAGVSLPTSALSFNATASQIQTAVQLLTGYSSVTVTGDYTSGFTFNFATITNPLLAITSNTTDATTAVIQSVQSAVNNIFDGAFYPYTDATVVISSQGYTLTFGNGELVAGQPTCSFQQLAFIVVNSNTMQNGSTITNINIVNSAQGAPAQGVGSATCIDTGPNFVSANTLTSIASPISGWNAVVNDLDCLTGISNENDTQAKIRRANNLQANANGPLASIVEKVEALPNVTTAIGIENLFICSQQIITISGVSSSGTFQLSLDGIVTGTIPYNPTATQIQSAITAITGYSSTLVTGSILSNFVINFNGSFGGKELALTQVVGNTTGLTINVSYGLPGKSFEIIVEGGATVDIANAILGSKPAGIETYGDITTTVFNAQGMPYNISFSNPIQVPIYVTINLTTDLLTSTAPQFNLGSIATLQQNIVAIGNAYGIGGLIIGFGTSGLVGSFNSIPGIRNYTLFFGRSPNPTQNINIQLQDNEAPSFQTFNISISYV